MKKLVEASNGSMRAMPEKVSIEKNNHYIVYFRLKQLSFHQNLDQRK